MCSICQRVIEPNPSKKSKKNQPVNEQMQALLQIVTDLISQFNSIDKYLQDCESTLSLENVEALLQCLSLNNESGSELRKEIKSSYHQTFLNLAKINKSKLKYLKSMIL